MEYLNSYLLIPISEISSTLWFFILNTLALFLAFIFTRIGARSWEIILVQKYRGELGSVMVIVTLLFGTSFASVLSFNYSDIDLTVVNPYLFFTYLFFILMNIMVLLTTVIIVTFISNLFNRSDLFLAILAGIIILALITQELLTYSKIRNEQLEQKEKSYIQWNKLEQKDLSKIIDQLPRSNKVE